MLVVDDFVPWRRFASVTLQRRPELQVIGEAFDGLEAVQKAQTLQPDLVLLDFRNLMALTPLAESEKFRRPPRFYSLA